MTEVDEKQAKNHRFTQDNNVSHEKQAELHDKQANGNVGNENRRNFKMCMKMAMYAMKTKLNLFQTYLLILFGKECNVKGCSL
jgi:hypothetical protein